MPLSKSTTDQIRKEAEEGFPATLDTSSSITMAYRDGYETGALAYAEKAAQEKEGLVKALEDIIKVDAYGYNSGTMKTIASDALKQYK